MSRRGRYVVLSQIVVESRTDVCWSIVEGELYTRVKNILWMKTMGEAHNTHGPDLFTGGRVQIVLYVTLIGERTNF